MFLFSITGGPVSAGRRAATILLRRLAPPCVLILLAGLCVSAAAQANEWAWMGGADTMLGYTQNLLSGGVYGAKGVFAPGNMPGMREGAVTWTDKSGNLWLFGGTGADVPNSRGEFTFGLLNDMWEFNPSTNQWAFMAGTAQVGSDCSYFLSGANGEWTCGVAGSYGTKGVASKANTPGSRELAVGWTDANGKLWLLGGLGFARAFGQGYFSDLWMFDPDTLEWTWKGGSSAIPGTFEGEPGKYGTKGAASASNWPGGRSDATACVDAKGNFWMFGGNGFSSQATQYAGVLADLWKFSPSSGEWTWVSGASEGTSYGVYGTEGMASPGNYPGAREDSACWVDKSGNLWLFGGNGWSSNGGTSYLNDFWNYNSTSKEWTWMGGSNQALSGGSYGNVGQPGTEFVPSARYEMARFTDKSGRFWLFGGRGTDSRGGYLWGDQNDLWMFDPSSRNWTWMSGTDINNSGWFGVGGTYGILGEPTAPNMPGEQWSTPGGRDLAAAWTDRAGDLWLFAGEGSGANGISWGFSPNDLWEYRLASATESRTDTPAFSVNPGPSSGVELVTITDATPTAAMYYSTNATSSAPVWSAYTDPVEVTSSETLSAIAIAPGELPSTPKSQTYELPTATPVIALPAGTYDKAKVQITDTTPGAVIYYTTNKSAPTTNSAVYGGQIAVTASETIEAMAVAPGSLESAVAKAAYTISSHAPATNQWTWMGGSSALRTYNVPQPGFYGTLRVAAKDNIPGGRSGAMGWTDKSGNAWLFGGVGADSKGNQGYLNDLWKLNTATGEWAWMGGNDAFTNRNWFYGVYGTKGQFAATNSPGSREYAATWVDKQGNLWMYGGAGYDGSTNGNVVNLNDLWEFNTTKGEWAWMGGPQIAACSGNENSSCAQLGTYGTERVAAPGNTPGGRAETVTWVDASGNLWLFGGSGVDSEGVGYGNLNELWKFNTASNEWAWMGGEKTVGAHSGQPGVYGELGVANSGNFPGARIWPSGWTDASGNLWLFGGDGYDKYGDEGELNDLWEYSPATNVWTWVAGSETIGAGDLLKGTYGTLGVPSAKNAPGARSAGLAWQDKAGNAWLLGGYGADGASSASPWGYLNDLWEFNSSTHEWTWMGGSNQATVLDAYGDTGMPGAYGTLASAAAGNAPGSREDTVGWIDSKGNLWLFGGSGVDAAGNIGELNDVWKFSAVAP